MAAATTDVKRDTPDRFAPSRHDRLCGLEFAIVNDGAPAHVAAFTAISSGRFIDAGRAPDSLGGEIPFTGKATWKVDLTRRLRAPIDYRLVAIVSDRPVADIANRVRRREDQVAAVLELAGQNITVHHAAHRVEP